MIHVDTVKHYFIIKLIIVTLIDKVLLMNEDMLHKMIVD